MYGSIIINRISDSWLFESLDMTISMISGIWSFADISGFPNLWNALKFTQFYDSDFFIIWHFNLYCYYIISSQSHTRSWRSFSANNVTTTYLVLCVRDSSSAWKRWRWTVRKLSNRTTFWGRALRRWKKSWTVSWWRPGVRMWNVCGTRSVWTGF